MIIPTEIEDVLEYPVNFAVPVIKPTATVKQKVIYADWLRELSEHNGKVELWKKNNWSR